MSNTTNATAHYTFNGESAACRRSVTTGLTAAPEDVTCGRCLRVASVRTAVESARKEREAAAAPSADKPKAARDYTNVYHATRTNRATGTRVTVATSEDLGLDLGLKWAVVCEDHASHTARPTRNSAIATSPLDFCPVCQAEHAAK